MEKPNDGLGGEFRSQHAPRRHKSDAKATDDHHVDDFLSSEALYEARSRERSS